MISPIVAWYSPNRRHYVFRVRTFGEASEAAEIAEQRGNLSAVAFELLLRSRRNDEISYLRRKETPQSADALDFAYLVGDALFKLLVQLVEIVEQPCVLDGDHGLGSEILYKINLFFSERTNLLTINY